MRAAGLITLVVLLFAAGGADAETASSPRLEGRLPEGVPLVSIDQPRGTVLDALTTLSKEAGFSLVVAAPESAGSRPLTIQLRKRPAAEALDLILEAGALRATFADGVLKVRPDAPVASADPQRGWRGRRGRHGERGDRVVVGHSLRIEAGEVVTKAVAVGGSVTVLGHVRGDTVAVGGSVNLRPGSRVDGDAVAIGGTVTVEEGARLEGDNVSLGARPIAWILGALTPLGATAVLVGLAWTRALLLFVIALLIALAFPDRVARVRTFLTSRPGVSSIGGVALVLGFIPLCVLLAVTIIGIALIPVAVMLMISLFLFGVTVVALWLGERIPLLRESKTPLKAVALGAAVLAGVALVPWIGTPLVMLAAVVSAGATLISRFGQRAQAGLAAGAAPLHT